MKGGLERRRVLRDLCPPGEVVVDVGADHGHVAAMVGGIATEKAPHLVSRRDVPWVVADGLRPFRRVDVAIIAGMGARRIAQILADGPRPGVVVLHAQDDPVHLRRWLASHAWRIEREALAPEAGRFAEVVRAVPGAEPSSGLALDFGPWLLEHGHIHLVAHLRQLAGHYGRIAASTEHAAPAVHRRAARCVAYVEGQAEAWATRL